MKSSPAGGFRAPAEERSSNGIILVFISGVLVLLFGVAMSLSAVVRISSRSSGLIGAELRLLSASGLEYAAARLIQDPFPRYGATPEVRADSWLWNDAEGTSLAAATDPSFARGERGADLDGDGQMSLWSGRLAGGDRPYARRFTLGIRCLDGRLPVNAGALWVEDRYGKMPLPVPHTVHVFQPIARTKDTEILPIRA